MTSPKAFLFDLDGTLADTDPLHFEAYRDVFKDLGVTIDRGIYTKRMSGRHNPDLLADFFPEHSAQRNERIADAKEARFRELATTFAPLPGAAEFLERAAESGARLALVTNAPRPNAEHMLRLLGFDTRFETVVVAGELARPKPDPLPYLHALQHLNVVAENAVAFEDSLSGVRSAVAAGLYTVGLTTSEKGERLREVGAALTAADFTEPSVLELLTF